jgi:glutamate synthase domain-containing protein 3
MGEGLTMETVDIDVIGLQTKDLSGKMRALMLQGAEKFTLSNVCGQRYIGTRLYARGNNHKKLEIDIRGTPGSDLGAFMMGHKIRVHGNVQDGVGNTMDSGEIVVEGRAGDVLGMSMRGGKIFIRDGAGYRTALHMKEYMDKVPAMVIGRTSQDFLGEYMAGGVVIVLDILNEGHKANFIGTGMHGGVMFLRGKVDKTQIAPTVDATALDETDMKILDRLVGEFMGHFPELGLKKEELLKSEFVKLTPRSKRPYGNMYAY